MRLLVLGGTVFLSRAVAAEAVRRGHAVTCACRGESGALPDGVRHVPMDRAAPGAGAVLGSEVDEVDAVVDVGRIPSWVRGAVSVLSHAHWVFVSSISAYADTRTPGGTPEGLPLLEPITTDEDPMSSPEVYGAMKVACERIVQAGAATSCVVRPGLIVGPGDPTGRFSYWPERLGDDEFPEVLAPGDPDDVVQLVDVRDLAAWLVDLAESRQQGVFDAVGEPMPRARLLSQVAAGVASTGRTLVWVPQGFLVEHAVEPWAGPRSLPLWLPLPEYAGLLAHDVRASYAAGMRTRPVAETAADTLSWLRATPDSAVTGLSREEEAEVLAAWDEQRHGTGGRGSGSLSTTGDT